MPDKNGRLTERDITVWFIKVRFASGRERVIDMAQDEIRAHQEKRKIEKEYWLESGDTIFVEEGRSL